jgi:3-isopropylmalate/(R)-2-methylmalate dehydratase small subunit
MQPFTIVAGITAPMPAANIDTDVIMPKQFLKGIDRSGLSDGTFHELRFDPSGGERTDFILNREAWRAAQFLVVGPNFGCGSSREHAVWGLRQRGIRALIGTSFAGIFFDNCSRNGLPVITIDESSVKALTDLATDPKTNTVTIDLPRQTITTTDGRIFSFDIEPERRDALILGLDAIGTTLQRREAIVSFEKSHLTQNPWLV